MFLEKKSNFLLCIFGIYMLLVFTEAVGAVVKVPKADTPPVIDGKLDDTAWQQAAVFTDFKTLKPDFGLPPSEKTEAYLIYDHENLYLGFRCYDREPEKIKATVTSRDNTGNDDWIAFCLDTFNDELSACFFMVNPLGIQNDGTLNSDADPDVTLDMIWSSAGMLTPDGYTAELAIPFKSLRYPAQETLVMGFKIARNLSRKSEEVDFPEYRPEKGAALAQFQKIALTGLPSNRLVEILPATTVSQKHAQQNGAMRNFGTVDDLSLTAKLGVTSELVLDATYNPDFSQVETDAGQIDVNLRSALFYPEKRSFFMEGQERFAFGANLEDTPLGAVVHTRTIVDPKVGLKLTGKICSNNIISAIYAQDEFPGKVAADDGEETLANRIAHFSIARYIRRLTKDSFIGGFYTSRQLGGSYNHVTGTDGRLRLSRHSFWEYHGFTSFTKDQNAADRVDGSALAAMYVFNSRRFYLTAGINDISKDFYTDVGYLTRTGVTMIPIYAQYSFYLSSGWLQRIEPYYWARHGRDKYSERNESFNVFSVRFVMPRQTFVNISGWLANEVFGDERFSRNAVRLEAETQILKQLALECDIRKGKYIYYDPVNPYQGQGTRAYLSVLFQPTGNISSGLEISYADFHRDDNGNKIYEVTIYRNRTVLQLNKYLFLRGVVEYNIFYNRMNADFLISFTYIPGTVIYLGYGSVYEKVRWQDREYVPAEDYLMTQKNLFFKASYLWRL
jgi:hypothetical protein